MELKMKKLIIKILLIGGIFQSSCCFGVGCSWTPDILPTNVELKILEEHCISLDGKWMYRVQDQNGDIYTFESDKWYKEGDKIIVRMTVKRIICQKIEVDN
jgi:hypothetical protein